MAAIDGRRPRLEKLTEKLLHTVNLRLNSWRYPSPSRISASGSIREAIETSFKTCLPDSSDPFIGTDNEVMSSGTGNKASEECGKR